MIDFKYHKKMAEIGVESENWKMEGFKKDLEKWKALKAEVMNDDSFPQEEHKKLINGIDACVEKCNELIGRSVTNLQTMSTLMDLINIM